MTDRGILDAEFWDNMWKNNLTGWDVGYASPPIATFLEQYKDRDARILIPGCGNAHEAVFMVQNNFTNITLVDISEEAVARLRKKFGDIPQINILCQDFFELEGEFDLIIEQTFFCTHPLGRREEYARKTASLLRKGGILAGVLFGKNFEHQRPPFGGVKEEYLPVFEPYFHIDIMEDCYNSISPRAGSELFIKLTKR